MRTLTEEIDGYADIGDKDTFTEGAVSVDYVKRKYEEVENSIERFLDVLGMWETSLSTLSDEEIKEVMKDVKSYDKEFAKIYALSKDVLSKANIRLK